MDHITAAVLIFGASLQVLCWALPPDSVSAAWRWAIGIVSGIAICYSVSVLILQGMGGTLMNRIPFVGWITTGAFVGAMAGGIVAWTAWKHVQPMPSVTAPSSPVETNPNLVRNPGFESGAEHWGTGYLEDVIRNGHWPEDYKRLPYVVGDRPGTPTNSSGQLDTNKKRNGLASFRFDHREPKTTHHYGSLSQRVAGLQRNRYYVVTFWVSARDAGNKSFFVTTDMPWVKRTYIPAGTYHWREHAHEFNTERDTYIDVRFVVETPCVVWIDDIELRELTEQRRKQITMNRAIALRENAVTTLLNRDVRRGVQWIQFSHDLKEWENSIVDILRQLGASEVDITWFRVLGTFTPKGLIGHSELHERDRNILAEKLDRLLVILGRIPPA